MPRFVPDPKDPTLINVVADQADLALLEVYAKLKQLDPAWRPQHEAAIPKPARGGKQ